ncbi:hypothetical protein, partial [Klebsiella aerogenes]|uniref:hypothetical protein n=1 Tax=Klebsiella aerogenes TaxID=548 RepID=UPI0019537CD6
EHESSIALAMGSGYLNDINYLSAVCGLDAWSDPQYWYLYKYSLNIRFIPDLCFEAAKVILE